MYGNIDILKYLNIELSIYTLIEVLMYYSSYWYGDIWKYWRRKYQIMYITNLAHEGFDIFYLSCQQQMKYLFVMRYQNIDILKYLNIEISIYRLIEVLMYRSKYRCDVIWKYWCKETSNSMYYIPSTRRFWYILFIISTGNEVYICNEMSEYGYSEVFKYQNIHI